MTPTLAELSIDLNNLPSLKVIVGSILALVALVSVGIPGLAKWLPKLKSLFDSLPEKSSPVKPSPEKSVIEREGTQRSSDQLPPEGFVEHLQIIKEAAPNGNAEVWWNYALQGMTEAQVAKSEATLVQRKAV